MARKTLTIGITINLENYENLRLEVQGEIGDDGNEEGLISFLDGMLGRLGHGDQATAERVEAYRRRVLAMPGSGATAPVQAGKEETPQAGAPTPRPVSGAVSPEPVSRPREPAPAEARKEVPPAREDQPATVRVSPESGGTKPAARAPVKAGGTAPGPQKPEPRKAPAPQPPQETRGEAGAQPERPPITEGEVACEGCGLSITKNQEKLSRLLTGKSLCKRCMNP